jgi:hypothetical protein
LWQPAINVRAATAMSEAKCLCWEIFTIFSFVRVVLKGLQVASASGWNTSTGSSCSPQIAFQTWG